MGTTLTALLWTGSSWPGARRRLARLPAARRRAHPDHPGPHLGAAAGRRGPDHRGGGRHHPQRSLLMRVLPGSGDDEPDLSSARRGRRPLPDLLRRPVRRRQPPTLEETLARRHGADEAAEELIQLALRGGAPTTSPSSSPTSSTLDGDDAPRDRHPRSSARSPAAALARRPAPIPPAAGRARPPPCTRAAPAPPARRAEDGVEPRRRRRRRSTPRCTAGAGAAHAARSSWPCSAAAAYAGYSWTQNQYYVGAKDDSVASTGASPQDLGRSASRGSTSTSDIELKYLPSTYQSAVERTHRRRTTSARPSQGPALRVEPSCRRRRPDACGRRSSPPSGHARAGSTTPTTPDGIPSTRRRAPPPSTRCRAARAHGDRAPSSPAVQRADGHGARPCSMRHDDHRRAAIRAPGATPSWSCSCSPSASRCSPTPTSAWPATARCPPACSRSASGFAACSSAVHLVVRKFAAVRRPAAAADRHAAQRPRAGDDLAPRPRPAAQLDGTDGDASRQLIWTALGVALVRRASSSS